ncbi:DUF1249 domain-containing protein [Microbulbifer sp. OS29]|uniref:DUF1249 domain-containing protein n=1 Tax=Microbulbifer okhotskensis TaxID=2926617 RepID=A0A9X2EJF4_9GAMM|nr:DUF1249 domain-containing protein [Microbulbifer okhotskensis]MCO1333352.1 DUF1249 domain-containing protein [Microbulbifer okhotskensis]
MALIGEASARQRKRMKMSPNGNGKTVYRVDLPSYHADCDANYLRLIRLLPDLSERELWRYQMPGGTLILRVAARSKYTTEVLLSAEASLGECCWLEPPNLTARLYHDARMAEVITVNGLGPVGGKGVDTAYPNPRMQRADERPQANRFLGEWLEYCLANGRAEFDLVLDGRKF